MADSVAKDRPNMTDADHSLNLQRLCRVCGKLATCRRSQPKQRFKQELLELFLVDIGQDLEHIHPENICDSHCRLLNRFREKKLKGEPFSTNTVLFNFIACAKMNNGHCAICNVSEETKCGRPKKKRKAGPGRGHTAAVASASGGPDLEGPVDKKACPTDFVKEHLSSLNDNEKKEFFLKFCDSLEESDRADLALGLGRSQSTSVYKHAKNLQSMYRSIDYLVSLDLEEYLHGMDSVTCSFLKGVCEDTKSKKQTYLTAHAMEIIYRMRNHNIVTPLCFLNNLDAYSLSGSKTCVDLNGAREPAGSYSTVVNWLSEQASDAPVCPDGDIVCVFDNDQVVGKSYFIKPNNKVKSSVITNCAWITICREGLLQKRPDLIPRNWLKVPEFSEKVEMVRTSNYSVHKHLETVHYSQLYNFLDAAIEQVKAEQVFCGDKYKDSIDEELVTLPKQNTIKCTRCDTEHQLPKGTELNFCSVCGAKFTKVSRLDKQFFEVTYVNNAEEGETLITNCLKEQYERFSHVESGHPEEIPQVKVADPVFVNPNSFQNIALVLRKIGKETGITRYGGTKRMWTVVVCDGLPFTLALQVVRETRVCSVCNGAFFGEDKLLSHFTTSHSELDSEPNYYFEFDWVLLKIGGGHYEMNMMKSFLELNWIPFMSEFSHILGYKTEKAQSYAKSGKDNHKTWFMILAFHIGTLNELVLNYVRDCIAKKFEPSGQHFYKMCKESMTHNFSYILEQVCTYSQAIVNMRMGTRRNNVPLIQSAKQTFRGIFHGRRHEKYQTIEITEAMNSVLHPPDLAEFLSKCQSLSKSGDPSKGQDFDFILEEINKTTKAWIPKGVPSDKVWQTVCRNIDQLEELRKSNKSLLGKETSTALGYRETDLTAVVKAWRVKLRQSGYLVSNDFCSVSGAPLDEELERFSEIAESKRSYLINEAFMGIERPDAVLHFPVFITPSEREKYMDIRNRTKEVINTEIIKLLHNLDDQATKKLYEGKLKAAKTKAMMLSLYFEVFSLLEEIRVDNDRVQDSENNDANDD